MTAAIALLHGRVGAQLACAVDASMLGGRVAPAPPRSFRRSAAAFLGNGCAPGVAAAAARRRARRRTSARDPALRIEQQRRGARFGELAGLAAELVVAPARAGAELRHADRLDDLVVGERGGEGGAMKRRPELAASGSADDRESLRRAPRAPAASRPPGRRARGCRRSCRDCAPRGRRCRAPPRAAARAPASGRSSSAAWVTPAPMRQASPVVLDLLQRRRCRDTSTSSSGRARRRFSIGPSDWPPAMELGMPSLGERIQRLADVARAHVVERAGLHAASRFGTRLRAFQRCQELARRQRRLGDLDAERVERVVDRVEDHCRRRDRAALAHALDAELGVGRRRLHVEDADVRHLGRPGQQVVGERRGERLAVRVVRLSSYSAVPMPCAMPPMVWPSTTIGLTSVPQSSTMT